MSMPPVTEGSAREREKWLRRLLHAAFDFLFRISLTASPDSKTPGKVEG